MLSYGHIPVSEEPGPYLKSAVWTMNESSFSLKLFGYYYAENASVCSSVAYDAVGSRCHIVHNSNMLHILTKVVEKEIV